MTGLVGILFTVMALCAVVSMATGAGIVIGVIEDSWVNRAGQRIALAEAIIFCVLGCIVILGTGA